MIIGIKILFWFSIAVIFYSYIGFVLLLICVGWLRKHRVKKAKITPLASLIITAYNEEGNIARKLKNSLELDYPAEALEIIVASDGSDDQTDTIVESYAGSGIRLISLPRRGKIFAIDEAVKQAWGEILVFSDANTLYHPQSLRKLAANFADPEVGGVCGNQVHLKEESRDHTGRGETLYWNYDKWLKHLETLTGSIISADGAIYAIRRSLYRFPASTAVTDDFAISTGVIARGYRLVYEKEALAFEKPSAGAEQEFSRKVRIMNRGLRGVFLRKSLLNPFRYGFYSLVLFTHKLLRRLVPFFLLNLLIMSMMLSGVSTLYLSAFLVQLVFYTWAGIGYLFRKTALGRWKIFYIPYFYCLANAAALIAILNLFRGKRIERWQPQRV